MTYDRRRPQPLPLPPRPPRVIPPVVGRPRTLEATNIAARESMFTESDGPRQPAPEGFEYADDYAPERPMPMLNSMPPSSVPDERPPVLHATPSASAPPPRLRGGMRTLAATNIAARESMFTEAPGPRAPAPSGFIPADD